MQEKKVIFFENIHPYGQHIKREFSNSLELLGFESCFVGQTGDSDYFIPYRHHDYESLFTLDKDNFREIQYKKMNLWEVTRGNVGYEIPGLLVEETKEDFYELEKIYTKAAYYLDFIEDLISRHQPAGFVVWGGMFFESQIITRLAKQCGIPSYAIEYSFDANRVYFDRAGVVGNRHSITYDWPEIAQKDSLSDEQLAWVQAWIQNNYQGKYTIQPEQGVNLEVQEFLKEKTGPVGLLLCQCFIDTVISMDSPHFQTTIAAYRAVIQKSAALGIPLVVKVHPGDREKYKEQIRQLCKSETNVLYIGDQNNVNVYSLMDACAFGITINSQAGLEMLAKGKNVLTLGKAFYGDCGFNVQLGKLSELDQKLLETSRTTRLNSSESKLCQLFLYKLLRNYLVDISQPLAVTARQVEAILIGKNHEELLPEKLLFSTADEGVYAEEDLRVLIVHPSPRFGGSGYYIQDLAKSLIRLGHDVLVLSEGSCPPIDEGVRWRKIKFLGMWLDPEIKEIVRDFSPNVLLQVGVRTKPIRVALEVFLMCNPLMIMQAEDDEVLAYQKHYRQPNSELLEILDRPVVFSQDVVRFMHVLNVPLTTEIWISPNKYRWVEPLMRILIHRMADQYCAIWGPMAERLRTRFGKPVDLLPPVVDLSKIDMAPMDNEDRIRILNSLGVDPDAIVYFINGTVYDFSDEFEIFVEAMRLYKKVASKPIAVLIGGNSRKDISVVAEESASDVTYKVLGHLNDRAYIDLIKASDVICAPGKDDIFNRLRLSSRLVKGMLLGKPIFTFRTGFGENLENNVQAFLTEIDTPFGWFHVLRQTEDKSRRDEVGENGRLFSNEHFDAAIVATRLAKSWRSALKKKRAGVSGVPGFLEPIDLMDRVQSIYDRYVPMSTRSLAGQKLDRTKIKPYEFKPNIALLYGFSHSKKGRFETVSDGIWVDNEISSFLVSGGGSIEKNITIRMRYEEGTTDLESALTIYDQNGSLEHERVVDDADLVINFKSESNIFVVVKDEWREPRNNPSDKRKLYWMLLDINFSTNS